MAISAHIGQPRRWRSSGSASGGAFLILTLSLSWTPVVAAVGVFLDRSQRLLLPGGQVLWSSVSNLRTYAAVAFLIAIVAVAILVTLRAARGGGRAIPATGALVAGLSAWLLIAGALRGDSGEALIYQAGALLTVVAIVINPPSRTDIARLSVPWLIIASTLMAHVLLSPETAADACRADKCSVFGSLWRAYLPQENVLGLYAALGAVLSFGAKSWIVRSITLALSTTLVVGSGSRTALAVLIIGIASYALASRFRGATRLLRAAPLLAAGAGVVGVFFSGSEALTNRGAVYEIVRRGLMESPLIGEGRSALATAYQTGLTGGYQFLHEHGQIAYILSLGGIGGLTIWLLAMCAWFLTRSTTASFGIALGAAAAVASLTEPVWELTSTSPYFWSLLVSLGSMHQRADKRDV